jgi:hypothetical protein
MRLLLFFVLFLWKMIIENIFIGRCETNIDECASLPCQNNGSCSDSINGYTCNCSSNYTGVECEIDVGFSFLYHLTVVSSWCNVTEAHLFLGDNSFSANSDDWCELMFL